MKTILMSICLALAMAVTASAGHGHHRGHNQASNAGHRAARISSGGASHHAMRSGVAMHHNISNARFHNRSHIATRHGRAGVFARNNAIARAREHRARVSERSRNNVAINRERRVSARYEKNLAANHQRVLHRHRNRNVAVTNNWHGDQFQGRRYAAFRDYRRHWHNRHWWRDHYDRIIFVMGGWWYWDAGYWYPALGYSPYAYYPYEGPIYGYSDLTPHQIIVQVQTQLLQDGYYAGPIDGILGPMTRHALADFQADHGLAITSTVDAPTITTLGLS